MFLYPRHVSGRGILAPLLHSTFAAYLQVLFTQKNLGNSEPGEFNPRLELELVIDTLLQNTANNHNLFFAK